jgi:hypothetical protein
MVFVDQNDWCGDVSLASKSSQYPRHSDVVNVLSLGRVWDSWILSQIFAMSSRQSASDSYSAISAEKWHLL